MSTIAVEVESQVEMHVDESRAAMDALIQDRLGISRSEFLRRVDAGEYAGSDDGQVLHLVSLAPFAR